MIAHAWKGYYTYAMGENELKPMSRRGHSAVVFGSTKVGATVVDSLDTLYITGLMEEYKQGRDWVERSLHFEQVSKQYQAVGIAVVSLLFALNCFTLSVLLLLFLFAQINSYISVFEFNIRFVGGLLSAFALTGDEVSHTHVLTHTHSHLTLKCIGTCIMDVFLLFTDF